MGRRGNLESSVAVAQKQNPINKSYQSVLGAGRERLARQMKLAGGDQRRHAAVHVVGDPAERVLRRRVLADGGMGVRIDQAGNRRNAVGVDGLIRRLV